jgi:hypothetical protein
MKMTQNMVIGISHRVVKYSVVQKVTELVANHYLKLSTNQTQFALGANYKNKLRKRVCQLHPKGVYIVVSCSLPSTPSKEW